MFKGLSIYVFRGRFATTEDCQSYLYDLKWSKGFVCSKCSCTEFYKGRTKWYRKCKSCNFDESVSSNTLSHGMKIPVVKDFEIIFMLSVLKKDIANILFLN